MKELKRREFLKLVSAGTCGAALHTMLAPVGGLLAFGQPSLQALAGPIKHLVVLNLSGGCSYNIAPIYHGAYLDRNPNVGFTPEQSLPLSPEQGLHPSLTGVKSVWDEGHLALLNMVGYPNPNRSHDESTQIWHAAQRMTGVGTRSGWGARLACQINDSIFNGVSLSGASTFTKGSCNDMRPFDNLGNLGEKNFWGGDDGSAWLQATRESIIAQTVPGENKNFAYVTDAMNNLQKSVQTVREQTTSALPVQFPNTGFGARCRDAAKLIAASALRTNLIYLESGGFDTHADERPRLTQNLSEINGGLTAFISCMKALNKWGEVVVLTMSEFCRTWENGSRGTDHGHAAPLFVMGGRVVGGIKSPTPSVAQVSSTENYLRDYAVDFRAPFFEAVQGMGVDPTPVFPEAFNYSPLGLIA